MAQIPYVTEREASDKWCPKSMVWEIVGIKKEAVSTNRLVGDCTCLGSSCMWWVWVSPSDASLGDRRQGFCGALMR